MTNVRIPNVLTDLAHVGTGGLPAGGAPVINQELETCKQWGYRIEEEKNRVFLRFDDDQIVPYWIQRETPDLAWEGLRVNGFLCIDSTNREALEQARLGAPGGMLICAEMQTAGRGRADRSWYSPAGTGLYFSLVTRPVQPEKYWPILTHTASVALFRAIKDLADAKVIPEPLDIDIKWPNDVLVSGKKCAGILLETLVDGGNRAVVIGVGVNVRRGSVPDELAGTATSIDEMAGVVVPRRKILVGFLQHFQLLYVSFELGKHEEILDSWKHCSSMWNGVPVWIEEGGSRRPAVTYDLSETGALVVQNEDGSRETVYAGDIRIRRF
jgi:BirA family biotin operon repressor/biotin-[acetyl-CoA-carboxylase] ligase